MTDTMGQDRIVIVSNRLPVSTSVIGDGWTVLRRSSGGLVNGLEGVHRVGQSLWLGSLASQTGTGSLEVTQSHLEDLRSAGLSVVDVPAELYTRYYEGMSNRAIWPLFHYMPERARFVEEDWGAYQQVNQLFADAVLAEVGERDTVWVHDYQLMLLPALLRRARRNLRIGFFLHIPFPAADVFRILPWRKELLAGVLGADLVGFHTLDHLRHFSNSAARVMGLEPRVDSLDVGSRTVRLGAFPLGIDVEKVHADARTEQCETVLRELESSYEGQQLILGVDRLDYTKGVPQRLEAFRAVLERNPDLVGRVSLVQVSVPSRVKVDEYQEIKGKIDAMVGEINGRFSAPGYAPIHYLFRTLSREHLYALYRRADVCLVTPIRDGLNLVCKEYVAAKGREPGALVLSEFAGSAAEMGEAILVNPWSPQNMIEGIERALTMPEERRAHQMSVLFERLSRRSNRAWSTKFLAELAEVGERNHGSSDDSPRALSAHSLTEVLGQARHVFVFLDYDGTLVELMDDPEEALPDQETRQLLSDLARIPTFRVAVASGRDRSFLESTLPSGLALICDHGACIRLADDDDVIQFVDDGALDELWTKVEELMRDFEARIPGSHIEKKEFGIVWHYRRAEPLFALEQSRALTDALSGLLQGTPLGVSLAKKAVEVRNVSVNKGDAVRYVLDRVGFDARVDALLTVGDDRTDEDMFRVYPETNISIAVGDSPTAAAYSVGRDALMALLQQIARSASGWQYRLWEQ